jgi:hypothetical protein
MEPDLCNYLFTQSQKEAVNKRSLTNDWPVHI